MSPHFLTGLPTVVADQRRNPSSPRPGLESLRSYLFRALPAIDAQFAYIRSRFTSVRGAMFIVFAVYDRVAEPAADASDCRIHGATIPVAVRDVDVYHHRLDSASRAPRLLRACIMLSLLGKKSTTTGGSPCK